jgi:enoyl-CoA hydratase/carnithine racemase
MAGLFEIKLHRPKQRNAIGIAQYKKLGELFAFASKDENTKVVILHGGSYFCSGNDLSALVAGAASSDASTNPEEVRKNMEAGVLGGMYPMLMNMAMCEKPTFALVRGGANGIAFTMLSHLDFIYCSPEAFFQTPFMASSQSPEGGSTLLFPQ